MLDSAGTPGPRKIKVPWKTVISAVVFMTAWIKQLQYHRYLGGLVKYTLPDEGAFKHIVCPHYTCECVLYLSLAVGAAPPGKLLNETLTCTLVFVAVNLGATAQGTKSWYSAKFGAEKVANKWRMIPFVF